MQINETPTLIVGLGGIGCSIADQISNMLDEHSKKYVGIIGLDTNIDDLKDVSIQTIQTSDERKVKNFIASYPHHKKWFPLNRFTANRGLLNGAGQIRSISWFVLDEVCQLLKREPEMAQVSVSINLPMTQLLDKGFIPRFLGVVDQAGVDRRQICIEFTERTILENFSQTQSIMNELNDAGIRFYLDDFGVGYSNFNCLLQLPFQMIKIDASFIRN